MTPEEVRSSFENYKDNAKTLVKLQLRLERMTDFKEAELLIYRINKIREQLLIVEDGVDVLRGRDDYALYLRFEEGVPVQDIADILCCTKQYVYMNFVKSYKKIARYIKRNPDVIKFKNEEW